MQCGRGWGGFKVQRARGQRSQWGVSRGSGVKVGVRGWGQHCVWGQVRVGASTGVKVGSGLGLGLGSGCEAALGTGPL